MIYDALGYYKILEVDVLADDKTIKIKYRDKAKQWHPDHNESENALEIFQKISVAYDILKDNKTRTMYDMLSMVYTQKEFPDFQTLKIYKDNEGKENPFLRVLRLYKYTKKGFKMEKPVVSYNDAIDVINKITKGENSDEKKRCNQGSDEGCWGDTGGSCRDARLRQSEQRSICYRSKPQHG